MHQSSILLYLSIIKSIFEISDFFTSVILLQLSISASKLLQKRSEISSHFGGLVLRRAWLILKSLAIVEWFICYKDIISVLKRPGTSSDVQKTRLWAVWIVTHSNSKCHASTHAILEGKRKQLSFDLQTKSSLPLLTRAQAVSSFLITGNCQAWCITIHAFPVTISRCRESRNPNIETTVTQYDFNLHNPCILFPGEQNWKYIFQRQNNTLQYYESPAYWLNFPITIAIHEIKNREVWITLVGDRP